VASDNKRREGEESRGDTNQKRACQRRHGGRRIKRNRALNLQRLRRRKLKPKLDQLRRPV